VRHQPVPGHRLNGLITTTDGTFSLVEHHNAAQTSLSMTRCLPHDAAATRGPAIRPDTAEIDASTASCWRLRRVARRSGRRRGGGRVGPLDLGTGIAFNGQSYTPWLLYP